MIVKNTAKNKFDRIKNDKTKCDEAVSCLYWSLMQNWNIPKSIQDFLGITEDYNLYQELENMDPVLYDKMRKENEVPDILDVDARLTRTAEQIFENICEHPPVPYLKKLDDELFKLGQIVINPNIINNPIDIRRDFLKKYNINSTATLEECSAMAEKAYRELDARCVKITGRRPYADELFSKLKKTKEKNNKHTVANQPNKTRLPKKAKLKL